ncbi:hypothetical protein [Kaistella faecalis]|uniref:hypothetical protein n=1 Tax=Kaistella faecalis TaxID=2852098 RepID=UPI001C47BA30|nr:hypothetical protein [Chryseobacterium faecale]UFK97985.1 hypothetical protein LL667_01190 [Chryseobacterium faecale]
MIKRLNYQQIDFEKYQHCIETSLQRNFYAKKEILDTLCEEWELLVSGDYDYIMPVPLKKKYGFHFVLMPLFCQQLGVFSKTVNREMEQQFLTFLKRNYRVFSYYFNHQNTFNQDLKVKKNYFIECTEYSVLRKNYFKGRKSTVKTAQYLDFKEVGLAETFGFINDNFKGLKKKSDFQKFLGYLKFLETKKMLRIFGAFKDNQLTSLAIMICEGDAFSLLGLVNDENYRLDNGASYLIDRILKENIHQKSFDFMGGSIRGIEVFFKSFGSVLQEYPVLENTKKDLLLNILRK